MKNKAYLFQFMETFNHLLDFQKPREGPRV
jgi:hypothetical protein